MSPDQPAGLPRRRQAPESRPDLGVVRPLAGLHQQFLEQLQQQMEAERWRCLANRHSLKGMHHDARVEGRDACGVAQRPCQPGGLGQPLGQELARCLAQESAVDPTVVDGRDQGVDGEALKFGPVRG